MTARSPLQNKSFRQLFIAQIIALVGTGFSTIALALLAYDLALNEAGRVLGIALAIKMVAYVFFAPIIGGFVHRLPRKLFLILMDVFRAIVVLMIPFISEIWHIYVLIFVLNLFSAGFKPVFQALIPDILNDEKQYAKALAYSRVAYDLENILSPTFAAIALLYLNYAGLFMINSLAFLISAIIVFGTLFPSDKTTERSGNIVEEVSFGIRSYMKTPRLRALFILYFGIALASSMIIVNTVIYVKDYLYLSDSTVAVLMGASGLGSMLIAFIYPSLNEKMIDKYITQFGVLILALVMFLMSYEPIYLFSLLVWFLTGIGLSLSQIPSGKIVNMSSSPSDRAAYFTAQFSLSHLSWFFGYLLAGQLVFIFGFSFTATLFSMIVIVCLLFSLLIWPNEENNKQMLHTHERFTHSHTHSHEDDHHEHDHDSDNEEHSHDHEHIAVTHEHKFFIDIHHQSWPK
ncbi:MAG: MFS transporter [Gammaproteobacteria bacterium]|nr:MFS transporter [Gammaproteobacteria bacterium]